MVLVPAGSCLFYVSGLAYRFDLAVLDPDELVRRVGPCAHVENLPAWTATVAGAMAFGS
jgi:hypothetical protein